MSDLQQTIDLLYKLGFNLEEEIVEKCKQPDWVEQELSKELVNLNHVLHIHMFVKNVDSRRVLENYIERFSQE